MNTVSILTFATCAHLLIHQNLGSVLYAVMLKIMNVTKYA